MNSCTMLLNEKKKNEKAYLLNVQDTCFDLGGQGGSSIVWLREA